MPELPILINHCGGPLASAPTPDGGRKCSPTVAAGLRRVAALPNVMSS